jgi:hypothetical protein
MWLALAPLVYVAIGLSFGVVTIWGRIAAPTPPDLLKLVLAGAPRAFAWRSYLTLLWFRACVWPVLLVHYVVFPQEDP